MGQIDITYLLIWCNGKHMKYSWGQKVKPESNQGSLDSTTGNTGDRKTCQTTLPGCNQLN